MTRSDILTVKELGGWETLDMVMVYAHLAPDHKADAMTRIEAVMNPGGQRMVKVIDFQKRVSL